MSEMPQPTLPAVGRQASNSSLAPWRSLRLLIAPAYTNKLIVSLVLVPKQGHPTLHASARQLETAWFPEHHQGELEEYALRVAFLRLSQTRF